MRPSSRPVYVCASVLALVSCTRAPAEPPPGAGSIGAPPVDPTTLPQPALERPTITIPHGTPPPTVLQKEEIRLGRGDTVRDGQEAEVNYVGVAWSTGREFDSSWQGHRTFRFHVGRHEVIPGWDQGVLGMRVGGRRKLTIPPALGYGERGAGADIGPNETLVFIVDLVSVH